MNKNFFALLFACLLLSTSFAQLKSPEEFLGYKIGTRYTPHWRLVSYFQHVADAVPSMVKMQQYGETNEHRPLYLAYISVAENISNMENIRQNKAPPHINLIRFLIHPLKLLINRPLLPEILSHPNPRHRLLNRLIDLSHCPAALLRHPPRVSAESHSWLLGKSP